MYSTRANLGSLDRLRYEQTSKAHSSFRARLPASSVQALATEVIDRLSQRFVVRPPTFPEVPPERLSALCQALLREDDETCLALVDELVADTGVAGKNYLVFLGAAARMLGVWWEEDKATFSEVTIGTGRIYAMLCALRPALIESQLGRQERHAVFASVPGEQHFLGVTMAADIFRSRGWQIDLYTDRSHEELVEILDRVDPVFIGLSGSGKRSVMPMVRLVVSVRAGHPGSYILVSGNVANTDISGSDVTGADLVTTDLDKAFAEMQGLANTS